MTTAWRMWRSRAFAAWQPFSETILVSRHTEVHGYRPLAVRKSFDSGPVESSWHPFSLRKGLWKVLNALHQARCKEGVKAWSLLKMP